MKIDQSNDLKHTTESEVPPPAVFSGAIDDVAILVTWSPQIE